MKRLMTFAWYALYSNLLFSLKYGTLKCVSHSLTFFIALIIYYYQTIHDLINQEVMNHIADILDTKFYCINNTNTNYLNTLMTKMITIKAGRVGVLSDIFFKKNYWLLINNNSFIVFLVISAFDNIQLFVPEGKQH